MPNQDNSDSGQGRSWRSTLSVSNRTEAEARLTELGYNWTWLEHKTLSATTPAMPAMRELPDGSISFFNQVIAVAHGWQRGKGSTAPVIFGDGSPIDDGILAALIEISQPVTSALNWHRGDIALVDNFRVMHGRHPYSGSTPRQVVVNLAR